MSEQEEKEWQRIDALNKARKNPWTPPFRWGCRTKKEELEFFAEHKGNE